MKIIIILLLFAAFMLAATNWKYFQTVTEIGGMHPDVVIKKFKDENNTCYIVASKYSLSNNIVGFSCVKN